MSDKPTCFVIQPFNVEYNKRFTEIYEPAIKAVGLEPHRADNDGVDVITDEIMNGIRHAKICFAEISEKNMNVWYELGFAHACDQQVVIVCKEDSKKDSGESKYPPFDITHRKVIFYDTKVPSDFDDLKDKIINALEMKKMKAKTKKSADDLSSAKSSNRRDNYIASLIESLDEFDKKILKMILDYYKDHYIAIEMAELFNLFNFVPENHYNDPNKSINKLIEKGLITGYYNPYTGLYSREYQPSYTAIEIAATHPELFK